MSGKTAVLSWITLSLAVLGGCGGPGPISEIPRGGIRMPPDTREQVTITQGVWGNVWFWEGDFMPGWGPRSGTVTAVVRDVLIFEPANWLSCTPSREVGGLFEKIPTKLVATTTSNATGFFQVSLPAGKYSIFVNEGSLYYAGWGDADLILGAVTVVSGSVTKAQSDIKYKAYE